MQNPTSKLAGGQEKQCMAAPGRLQGRAAILCFCAVAFFLFSFNYAVARHHSFC
jgi:hypothetical protein